MATAALAALAALVLGGCGGDDGAGGGGAGAASARTVAVSLTDDGCSPQDLELPAGPTTWAGGRKVTVRPPWAARTSAVGASWTIRPCVIRTVRSANSSASAR